jgi:Tannase and feruloyl esterase
MTAAAVSACDALDGLVDGIIAAPENCYFNPHTLVGKSFNCSGVNTTYTASAACKGAQTTNGTFLWYGLNPRPPFSGLLNTTCSNLTTGCGPAPFTISSDWIGLWIENNPAFDITSMSFADYDTIFHQSNNQYASIIGTADPDLSAFAANSGKMITWHGLADQLIFPNGTVDYYNRVLAGDPAAHEYYRFFEAPGVGHCGGGFGPVPSTAFESVVSWVETGVEPATLNGTSAPDVNGTVKVQPLSPYRLVSAYQGRDPAIASSFACTATFK